MPVVIALAVVGWALAIFFALRFFKYAMPMAAMSEKLGASNAKALATLQHLNELERRCAAELRAGYSARVTPPTEPEILAAFELADTVRCAEQFADSEASAARSTYVGESAMIPGLSLPVYEDPVPQDHPNLRMFREGVAWAHERMRAQAAQPKGS